MIIAGPTAGASCQLLFPASCFLLGPALWERAYDCREREYLIESLYKISTDTKGSDSF